MKETPYVITIGRQFGSGGRELGALIASRLGISFYDKALLLEAAKAAGVSTDFFERSDEKFPSFLNGILSPGLGYNPFSFYSGTSISDDHLYRTMSDIIRAIAYRESCVIVGRSADYVLRDHPKCINIFVHAPMEECVRRIMRRGDKTNESQSRALAEKTNRLRSEYYNFYTDKTWGSASCYDLCMDSSLLPLEQIADIVVSYVKLRLAVD